jgi:hypothetical protein
MKMNSSKSVGRNTFQINSNQIHKNNNNRSKISLSQNKNNHTNNNDKDLKRQKLKDILIEKFTKKFGLKNSIPFLNEEISNFLNQNKLTEQDLINLEQKITKVITEMRNQENLRNNLSSEGTNNYKNNFKDTKERENLIQMNSNENQNYNQNHNHNYDYYNHNHNHNIQNYQKGSKSVASGDVILPDLINPNHPNSDLMSVRSKYSRMSGASHLSKFDEDNAKLKLAQMTELDFLKKKEPKPERFDFTEQGDEWNAIVFYNQKLHKDNIINNKVKDFEVKKRIKEDLDNQIRMKYKRKFEERLKEKEFDKILLDHCDYLSELDRQRQEDYKEKVMKDKENRDKQLIDEKKKKRKEIIKEKRFDREVVKNIKEEIAKEKDQILQKRANEMKMLQVNLKENEINRLRKLENMKKEKFDDIKAMEENTKVMERQENERKEYFRKIERNSNNFVSTNANFVLFDLKKNTKDEDEKMKKFMEEKELR